jgi:hypothetical protein
MKGHAPRTSPTARRRDLLVRVSGEMHARLVAVRDRRGLSLNAIVLDALENLLAHEPAETTTTAEATDPVAATAKPLGAPAPEMPNLSAGGVNV